MGLILSYIEKNSDKRIHCYKTRKVSLDDKDLDAVSSDNSDMDTAPLDSSGKIAEDNQRRVNVHKISQELIDSTPPYFSYFLDGSRHTYKVDDIAIGNKIFPVVAGQVVVGCCHRPNRDHFQKTDLRTHIVLSLPKHFKTTEGKPEDFARLYCEKLNSYLLQNNKFVADRGITISSIVFYKTDGPKIDPSDKDRYKNSAIARIQDIMTDDEQLMVHNLCQNKLLNEENWLIKDGSLQYNPNYTYLSSTQWNSMRSNYQYVVGVSKSFNPDLLKNYEGEKLSQIIANLKPGERTKAYKYKSELSNNQFFAVWYVRLRKSDVFRENNFSDIIKCEMIMFNPSIPIKSSTIDAISANLIREAYPVCFGSDVRWGNHIYPVYLTESFCKSQYIDSNIFLSLF